MKYCVNYSKDFRYRQEIDEVIVQPHDWYSLDFKDYPKARFILDMSEADLREDEFMEATILKAFEAKAKYKNEKVIMLNYNLKSLCPFLKEHNIKFFFDAKNDYVFSSLDGINLQLECGVSDVYILNELGFRLKTLSEYLHEKGINIRVIPNVSQYCGDSKIENQIKGFFIRPEDIMFYEEYADTLELFCDGDKTSVLYKIYTSGEWRGDIRDIVKGLESDVPSVCFMPYFGEKRAECGKKCAYGNKCDLCTRVLDVGKAIYEKGIYFSDN